MTAPTNLTPEQKDFLARACALIESRPAQQEVDRLFTLAAMLLPDAVVKVLRRRAASATGSIEDESQLGRWIQDGFPRSRE